MSRTDAAALRGALRSLPEDHARYGADPIPTRFLYVPRAHKRALDPENMLVVGIRGAGKTLWWQALLSKPHREIISTALNLRFEMIVDAGFGGAASDKWPVKDMLQSLVARGFAPRDIWWTVVLQHVHGMPPEAGTEWEDRLNWYVSHREQAAALVRETDDILASMGQKHLVVFDALDLTADTRYARQRLLAGLLEVTLECRGTRALRVKTFVRPDMLDAAATSFPDSSKLLTSKVDLRWPADDLYGLLWQYLGNAETGREAFLELLARSGAHAGIATGSGWRMPPDLGGSETQQRRIFEEIAGPWMGRDARRGIPYTWFVSHLADARNQTSPRTFLAAVRSAAVEAEARYSDHPYALHYEAIKKGVQAASSIRVAEVSEDYPWVKTLMSPLENMLLPIDPAELFARWEQRRVWVALDEHARLPGMQTPARLAQRGWGVIEDLKEIGICELSTDGRVNFPDVYRVAFQMRRRGGVKPIPRE